MKYALWLSNIPGIGAAKIHALKNEFSSAEEIFFLKKDELILCHGISEKDVANIIESKRIWDLDKEYCVLKEKGIQFISMEQDEYPNRLRTIINPPYSLYYIGKLPAEEEKTVAIVGARGRSAYGSQVAEKLSKSLAAHKIGVISGLAKGIDADGHKGALLANGTTYAVLGCGVDICYPRENQYLYNQIMINGGIISEYPPHTNPNPRLFPARNRIISALSDCVIVIEAREKSGSLITADFAMEQGKDVYALPGRITDSLSGGCNQLIKQGAGVFLGVEDFLTEWHLIAKENGIQMDFRKKLLEKEELLVYSLLDFHPIGIGTIMERTAFCLTDLILLLESLEQKGFIKESMPNYYIRTV